MDGCWIWVFSLKSNPLPRSGIRNKKFTENFIVPPMENSWGKNGGAFFFRAHSIKLRDWLWKFSVFSELIDREGSALVLVYQMVTQKKSSLFYLTCLSHLIRTRADTNPMFFLRKELFSYMLAQHVLSYHLI